MLKFVETADDAIACSLSGKIGQEDIGTLARRIVRALERQAKTHVFVEVETFGGTDWRSLVESLPETLPLLGKLDRFGRIAVVSDDSRVRRLARVESALLPRVGFEVFDLSERDRALAWVEGRTERPHRRALRAIPTDNAAVLAFAADGWITEADLETAIAELEPVLERREGKIDMLVRVGEVHIGEWSPLLGSRYFQLKMQGIRRVGRYALVGGPEWLRALAETFAPLTPVDFRHFPAEEEGRAWSWLGARPAGEEAPVATAAASG